MSCTKEQEEIYENIIASKNADERNKLKAKFYNFTPKCQEELENKLENKGGGNARNKKSRKSKSKKMKSRKSKSRQRKKTRRR